MWNNTPKVDIFFQQVAFVGASSNVDWTAGCSGSFTFIIYGTTANLMRNVYLPASLVGIGHGIIKATNRCVAVTTNGLTCV